MTCESHRTALCPRQPRLLVPQLRFENDLICRRLGCEKEWKSVARGPGLGSSSKGKTIDANVTVYWLMN